MAHDRNQASLWDYLKNIFLLLLFIQFLPPLIQGIKKQYGKLLESQAQVGVIPIRGVLYNSSKYNKELITFFKDPAIKAILLKIECPGSAAGTGQALFNEIIQLKKLHPKPVIVLVENVCASGGYYIASAADYIISSGTATIGSIGTYLPAFQLKEFIEQFKIQYSPIKTGTYKTITDPFTDKTPEEKALLQEFSDDVYKQFTESIATQRKLSLANINLWADGKIFTARQALKLGLIDEIGSAQNAIQIIKQKALIDGEIEWVHPPAESNWAWLLGNDNDSDDESLLKISIHSVCDFIQERFIHHG